MSHIVRVQAQVKDAAAVRAACQRLGLPAPVQGTTRLFSGEVTGLAVQLRAAGALLEEETKQLGRILRRRALEHRDTVMMGRTHGVHAEPITFGMVLGLWAFEVKRGLERLQRAVQQVSVG